MSATNATKSATDATKPATDSETKDGGKANNITATIKDEVGGNGGNGGNGGKVGGNGGKVGGNGGNSGINTDESVGYEADIIRYVRLHPNATQRSINTAIGVPLRTIQRIMSQLQNKGILIREGSRRLGQWKVID
jgi:possible transcriptional regulator